MLNKRIYLTTCLALFAATGAGCLSTFDTDSVELEDQSTPEPDPNPETATPDAPNPDTPAPDMNPDPEVCEDGSACDTGDESTLGACQDGDCLRTECAQGFLDCDDDLGSNGCEATTGDIETCGSCDNTCSADNAAELGCDDGVCLILSCNEGFLDNDGGFDNGCETAIPAAIDFTNSEVIAHGVRLAWETEEDDPLSFIVSWTQPGSDETIEREVSGQQRQRIFGPIDIRGDVTFFIQVVSQAGVLGPPGEGFTVSFIPRGWFGRSPGAFYVDGEVSPDGTEALAIGIGVLAHFTGDGSSFISGKIPQRFGGIGFDVDFGDDPPLRGTAVTAGFLNEVLISRDGGLSWLNRPPPNDEFVSFQAARILNNGRIILGGDGQRPVFTDDFGRNWVELITPEKDSWFAMDYVEDGDQSRLFMVGEDRNSEDTILIFSDDDCETFETINLVSNVNGQTIIPSNIFALKMLNTEIGFMGADDLLLKTRDHWQTSEVVELPGPRPDSFVRIRFNATGEIGIITAEDSLIWTTTDGGESWNFESFLIDTENDDETFALVTPIPNQPGDPFVLMSTTGRHIVWVNNGNSREFFTIRDGVDDDFIGAVIPDIESIVAVSENGIVYGSGRAPETMLPTGVEVDIGPSNVENFGDSRPRLNQMASSRSGDVMIVVGNNFKAHSTVNRGSSWTNLLGQHRFNEDLIGVDINNSGTAGLAVGNGEDSIILLEFNRSQSSILSNIPIDEVSADRSAASDLSIGEVTAVTYHPTDPRFAFVIKVNSIPARNRIFIGTKTNGRRSWTTFSFNGSTINSLEMPPGSDEIWMGGEGGTLQRIVRDVPQSIIFPAPPGIDRNDMSIGKVYFPNNDEKGWLLTDVGVILATNNGGQSWVTDQACTANVVGVGCDDIFVVANDEVGILVGEHGTVALTVNGGVP